MRILSNLDLNFNQLLNFVFQKLATDPTANLIEGRPIYNSAEHRAKYWNGETWIYMDALGATMTAENMVAAINASTQIIDLNNLPANVGTAVTNSHTHDNKTVLDAVQEAFTTLLKTKLDGIAEGANNYSHPTGDGNLHVPANGTTNNGRVLTSGSAAGTYTWQIPSVAWANILNKPTSTAANIDAAVTNSHTHSNKTLLDTYTQTEANLADAVSKKHSQNSDTGTSSATFTIGTSGVKLKNNGGTELELRNNADTDYADLRVRNLTVDGTTTHVNSTTVDIGDNEIELNSDVTTAAMNSDGGLAIKRLAADNATRKDAKLTFNESIDRWQQTYGDTAAVLATVVIPGKATASIGDGSATQFEVTHGLGTRAISVHVRETASPYEEVWTTNEATTLNTVTLKFAVAPTSNQYEVTIIG